MLLKKARAILQIMRPELPFAAGVCVLAGEVIALGKFPTWQAAGLGFLSSFGISAAAIVLNDYFDLEVDRVNTPERPLPSGILSSTDALVLTSLAAAIGLAAAALINLPAFILCVILTVTSFLYNWKTKQAGLRGNLMVSFCVASTFLLGGMAVGAALDKVIWTFALMAFCLDLGEEIAGDAMDIEGDKRRGSQSIAIRRGKKYALRLSSGLFGLVVVLSWLPVVFKWLRASYLIMISITDVTIILFTISLLRSKTPEQGRKSMRRIYLGVLLGVLAFIIGMVFK